MTYKEILKEVMRKVEYLNDNDEAIRYRKNRFTIELTSEDQGNLASDLYHQSIELAMSPCDEETLYNKIFVRDDVIHKYLKTTYKALDADIGSTIGYYDLTSVQEKIMNSLLTFWAGE